MPPSTLQTQIIASAKRFPKDVLRPEIDFGAVVLELANERFAALESQGRSHQLNRSDERLLMNVQIGLRSLIDNDWRKKVGRHASLWVAARSYAGTDGL